MKFPFRAGNVNKKQPIELQKLFRKIFTSSEGLEILRVLLSDWCFFDTCRNDQDRAMNEYAKYFLNERLGLAAINVYTELDLEQLEKTMEDH